MNLRNKSASIRLLSSFLLGEEVFLPQKVKIWGLWDQKQQSVWTWDIKRTCTSPSEWKSNEFLINITQFQKMSPNNTVFTNSFGFLCRKTPPCLRIEPASFCMDASHKFGAYGIWKSFLEGVTNFAGNSRKI